VDVSNRVKCVRSVGRFVAKDRNLAKGVVSRMIGPTVFTMPISLPAPQDLDTIQQADLGRPPAAHSEPECPTMREIGFAQS
jgi:hypothetical protein